MVIMVVLKNTDFDLLRSFSEGLDDCLTSETVQSAALSLERMHHIQSSDRLAAGMLSIGYCVTDHVLKEHLQDTSGLFVDQAGDALHATSAGQSSDGGLGDALDVVSQDLSVALGASFSKSFSSFSSSRHDYSK